MDLTDIDIGVLAEQLRKPEGEVGSEVGIAMSEFNTGAIVFTIESLHIKPTDHILEIGFGPGEGIAEAARLTPQGYVAGIDHSQEMFDMTEERNYKAIMQEHVELTLGDAKELPYDDESFDVVFAVNVFHFWEDPSPELAECRRVLKPGGTTAFFLMHPSSWLPGIRETGVFIPREAEDVEQLLQTAGFTDIEIHTTEIEPDGKGFLVMGKR